MRITVVAFALACGGAERIIATMATRWAAQAHQVRILLFAHPEDHPIFYPVPPNVEVVHLGIYRRSTDLRDAIRANARRISVLRRSILSGRPDVVISHLDRPVILTALALRRSGIPHIGYLHSDPARRDPSRLWRLLRWFTLSQPERLVLPARGAIARLPRRARRRATHIPNPVTACDPGGLSQNLLPRPNILNVANLRPEKNHALLLKAFAKATEKHPDWHLVLAGTGPLAASINALTVDLGIEARVHRLGVVKDVGDCLNQADIFAFSSRHEGFGLALCEAMAAGVAVVATDCPVGPRDIIRHEVDGLLVPNEDIDAFAAALTRLIDEPSLRQRLGARAPEVLDRFGVDTIMEQWDDLLDSLTHPNRVR